ncbi:RICIN domain-containing protein [Actinosynnema sp. NPDC004786]
MRFAPRARALVVVATLFASLTAAIAPNAQALPVTFDRTDWPVVMGSVDFGMTVHVKDFNREDGAVIAPFGFVGYSNEFWRWRRKPAAGYYDVVNAFSGKCLDVQWGSHAIGAPVWQWPCNGLDAQLWRVEWLPGTTLQRYVNRGSGLCLTMPAVRGQSLYQDVCGSRDGQAFDYIRPLVNPVPITDPPTTKVITYTSSGAAVMSRFAMLLEQDLSLEFRWTLPDGHVINRIHNEWRDACLTVGALTGTGAPVSWAWCSPGAPQPGVAYPVNQLWTTTPVGTDRWGSTEYQYRYYTTNWCLTRDYVAADRLGVTACNPADPRQRWRDV